FDTLRVQLGSRTSTEILRLAEVRRMNFRHIDEQTIGISLDETTTEKDVAEILRVFNGDKVPEFNVADLAAEVATNYGAPFVRSTRIGWGRSAVSPAFPSSPTPVPRANLPVCSSFARGTRVAAKAIAKFALFPRRLTGPIQPAPLWRV